MWQLTYHGECARTRGHCNRDALTTTTTTSNNNTTNTTSNNTCNGNGGNENNPKARSPGANPSSKPGASAAHNPCAADVSIFYAVKALMHFKRCRLFTAAPKMRPPRGETLTHANFIRIGNISCRQRPRSCQPSNPSAILGNLRIQMGCSEASTPQIPWK